MTMLGLFGAVASRGIFGHFGITASFDMCDHARGAIPPLRQNDRGRPKERRWWRQIMLTVPIDHGHLPIPLCWLRAC